jgi:hypothetical protein
LLRQRRAVDDHRVLAAGLGDQNRIVVAFGELTVDKSGHVRRTGEEHASDPRIGNERRTHGFAAAGQKLKRTERHTSAMKEAHRLPRR